VTSGGFKPRLGTNSRSDRETSLLANRNRTNRTTGNQDMTDLRELPIRSLSSHSRIALGSSREIAEGSASIDLDQPLADL